MHKLCLKAIRGLCYYGDRFLAFEMNKLIVALLEDDCSGQNCPEMRSSDWQYLCAGT